MLTVAKNTFWQRGLNEQNLEVNEHKWQVNEEILYQTKRGNKGGLDFLTWFFAVWLHPEHIPAQSHCPSPKPIHLSRSLQQRCCVISYHAVLQPITATQTIPTTLLLKRESVTRDSCHVCIAEMLNLLILYI